MYYRDPMEGKPRLVCQRGSIRLIKIPTPLYPTLPLFIPRRSLQNRNPNLPPSSPFFTPSQQILINFSWLLSQNRTHRTSSHPETRSWRYIRMWTNATKSSGAIDSQNPMNRSRLNLLPGRRKWSCKSPEGQINLGYNTMGVLVFVAACVRACVSVFMWFLVNKQIIQIHIKLSHNHSLIIFHSMRTNFKQIKVTKTPGKKKEKKRKQY